MKQCCHVICEGELKHGPCLTQRSACDPYQGSIRKEYAAVKVNKISGNLCADCRILGDVHMCRDTPPHQDKGDGTLQR
uniref:Uncharacterized protein n=1 Tax=Anguilla anguilla TaxID=7936 RepID=A0A0E9UGF8_ANGAN